MIPGLSLSAALEVGEEACASSRRRSEIDSRDAGERIEEEVRKFDSRQDIERLRWVLDAKVRALGSLCSLTSSGKGDVHTRDQIYELARQIRDLKP